RALVAEDIDLMLDRRDTATAGVDHHANAVGVLVGDLEFCLLEGLPGGRDGELREPIHAAGRLEVHEVLRLEIGDLTGDGDVQTRRVEPLDSANAGAPFDQPRPECVPANPKRADRADAGHYNTCHHTHTFM